MPRRTERVARSADVGGIAEAAARLGSPGPRCDENRGRAIRRGDRRAAAISVRGWRTPSGSFGVAASSVGANDRSPDTLLAVMPGLSLIHI